MTGFVVTAGGTGGHLFPAEALAGQLAARGAATHLFTDRRVDGFASDLPGVEVVRVRAGRLGGGPLGTLGGVVEIALGVVQARRLLRRLEPAAVVGFGGYVSLPTMLAATQLGFPTVIHEQNAVLGRANRLLARRVHRIATGFAETAALRAAERGRATHTGNPVRPAFIDVAASRYDPPEPGDPVELLITGGSQGARIFSEIVPAAIGLLPPPLRAALRLAQQARPEDLDGVAEQYERIGVEAEVQSFFLDMPHRLQRAHLAICRSGASTIAELAAVGRPALLVPYPFAADDHQSANARAFANAGGGWVIPQPSLSAPMLANRLAELLTDPGALRHAAVQARAFARDDAAARLADLVFDTAPATRALAPGDAPMRAPG